MIACPSIEEFRNKVCGILADEVRSGTRRSVVVFAVDGITNDFALRCWPNAAVSRMHSVFPSTSSSAWLTSLTGLGVASHGVPGVVFKSPGGELINVFQYRGH